MAKKTKEALKDLETITDKELNHDKIEMPTPVERAAIFAHNLKSEVASIGKSTLPKEILKMK